MLVIPVITTFEVTKYAKSFIEFETNEGLYVLAENVERSIS
ncbi:hypothetical protein [Bacillus suaedaesalsae]|nr:hypothetical protein [Bacillus suaedaesalsae]